MRELPDPCLEWPGYCVPDGYGRVKAGDRSMLVHRMVWEAAHGPLGEGEEVLHHCDNPPCYRLSHLFKGTQLDNIADMDSKGRRREYQRGEANPQARLTNQQASEIRKLYASGEWTQVQLGKRFGVRQALISRVVRGETY